MEFCIPITRFDPSNVKWQQPRTGPFRRTIPFGYEENNITFNNLILGLHPLKVIDIDRTRNQLILEEPDTISLLTHVDQFQIDVSNELEKNSRSWVEESKLPSIIKSPLQPWLKSRRITLYLSTDPSLLHFYIDGKPAVFSYTAIKPGDMIRAIVKVQGLSLQMSEDDNWTGKSRIQHHILQLYKVSGTTD
jgi:hypothetical protein